MSKNRYRALSNASTDSFRARINGKWCVYCGMLAETKEHFPPASLTHKGLILPCCRECNRIAGTLCGADFQQRIQIVKTAIGRKYKRVLNMPVWTMEEMEDLGYAMKEGIEAWQKEKRIAKSRIAWNAMSYLASIDHHNAFARFVADYGSTME